MFSPKNKLKLVKTIPFVIVWGIFGLLLIFIEQGMVKSLSPNTPVDDIYEFNSALIFTGAGSFVVGFLFGLLDVFFFSRMFMSKSFFQKLLSKTALNLLLILGIQLVLTTVHVSIKEKLPMVNSSVLSTSVDYWNDLESFSTMVYAAVVLVISIFLSEVLDYVGPNIYKNFFTGKYVLPGKESRIFMFLDMKSSTSIAERLGDLNYFKMLKKFYEDSADVILTNHGEVYQYAGDEVIVSWPLKTGLMKNNCLHCFFDINDLLKDLSDEYLQKFGLVPEFKAGLHCGEVITGEVGGLKKEIFFTGDVLNTTSRIQNSCNDYQVDILISETLMKLLSINASFMVSEIGDTELKGKTNRVKLFTIGRKTKKESEN